MGIEAQFEAAISSGKINGAVLCATDTRGNFAFRKALGHRTLLSGDTVPQQLDDILCLGSATKLITTVAALQCVEDGSLSLDGDDLASIAPELASLQVLAGFGADGDQQPQYQPPSRPVTLRMLLTHTSGITYYFLDPNVMRWRNRFASPASQEERQHVEGDAKKLPLGFQPGTGWMYGPGIDWAGRLVERITGQTLGDYMQERIFGPLANGVAKDDSAPTRDHAFYPVTSKDIRSRMVDLNPLDRDGLGIAALGGGGAMNKTTQGDFGGHGLFASGAAYLRVLRSLLANDGVLLKPETVDVMFSTDLLSPSAETAHQSVLSGGALGAFLNPDADNRPKTTHGLGGVLLLEPGVIKADAGTGTGENKKEWYGAGTMSWSGGLTVLWFIDRARDLCGFCSIQPSLPIQGSDRILYLKQHFFKEIYQETSKTNKL